MLKNKYQINCWRVWPFMRDGWTMQGLSKAGCTVQLHRLDWFWSSGSRSTTSGSTFWTSGSRSTTYGSTFWTSGWRSLTSGSTFWTSGSRSLTSGSTFWTARSSLSKTCVNVKKIKTRRVLFECCRRSLNLDEEIWEIVLVDRKLTGNQELGQNKISNFCLSLFHSGQISSGNPSILGSTSTIYVFRGVCLRVWTHRAESASGSGRVQYKSMVMLENGSQIHSQASSGTFEVCRCRWCCRSACS